MKKCINRKVLVLIITFVYVILFFISSFILRKNGLDYMSYVYKFHFILFSILIISYSLSLIAEEMKLSKFYSYIIFLFTFMLEAIFLFLIFFTLILVLDIGDDSIVLEEGKYYIQSDKYYCGSLHETECTEQDGFINKYVKRIRY